MATWPLMGRLGSAAGSEPAVIITIAGQGVGRTPYGLAADLAAPRTAAVDSTGMIWFTDTGHHQVKRLDPATGLVTVVAGTGMAGALGDGRAAVSASLDMPHGVAVDNQGRIYIADSANNRIRMVTLATGLITTVAGTGRPGGIGDGGPATAAELDHPRFLVVAADGSLIVADTGNHRVRRIDPSGVISTIAGTGRRGFSGDGGPATAADLDDPRGLALAADGTVYVAGGEGVPRPSVRRIDPTGIITTIAGGLPAGYSGDGGPATAAALNSPRSIALWGTDLYIADSDNSRIRHVDLVTGIIDTVVGTGTFGFGGDHGPARQARVGQPRGVAVTPTGDLVIGDTLNSRLRLVRFNRPALPPAVPAEPTPVAVQPLAAPEVEVPAPGDVTPVEVPQILPTRPSRDGYRLVASDGGIFAFGDAGFFGSTGALTLAKPIVGMASTPSGRGYWLVASDGGIFAFGDAGFFGSTGALRLTKPIVGMTPSATGNGYRLVASDGGIFSFGDAAFFGSTGKISLAEPIVGMAATSSGQGYWLVASDGGIFSFGDGTFYGSPAGRVGGRGVVGVLASPSGQGYRVATGDGVVSAFGDATDAGSVRDGLRLPVVGIGG